MDSAVTMLCNKHEKSRADSRPDDRSQTYIATAVLGNLFVLLPCIYESFATHYLPLMCNLFARHVGPGRHSCTSYLLSYSCGSCLLLMLHVFATQTRSPHHPSATRLLCTSDLPGIHTHVVHYSKRLLKTDQRILTPFVCPIITMSRNVTSVFSPKNLIAD